MQQPAPDAGDDDDEDDVSVPSSTPETALPPSLPTASSSSNTAAACPSTSGPKSKKKVHTPGDADIVQLLLQQQERSQAAAHSNVPQIHDRVWPVYLKMEMENYIWALNESDNIREQQQCQQQAVPLVLPPVQIPQPQQLQVPHQIINQQQQQQQHHQLQQQHQQQYQFPQFAAQVLPVPGPSQVSTNVGGSGSTIYTSLIGQSTPRPSLGDLSFSSMLRGATDTLSPGDFLDDTDTHHS